MSNQNKVLIIAVALVAFVVGAAFYSSKDQNMSSVSDLLNAKLLTSEGKSQTTKSLLKEVNLINFWASWCTPCKREMPLFQSYFDASSNQGFQIIGIAIDDPENTVPMLDSMGITYPILYAEQTGITLMEMSGNELGAMPYSLLVEQNGNVIDQKLGEIHEEQIEAWVRGQPYEESK